MNKKLIAPSFDRHPIELRVSCILPMDVSPRDAMQELRAAIRNGDLFAKRYTGPGDRPCLARAANVRVEFI